MHKYTATLSVKSLDKLISDLESYRDSLDDKTEQFVNRLLENGITIARNVPGIPGSMGTHKFERFVWFSKELNPSVDGCTGILWGDGRTFNVTWGENGEKSGSINSLLAIEFGTAAGALPVQSRFGVVGGKGTNSFHGHENDSEWYFANGKDTEGNIVWKRATAITPSRPMAKAADGMKAQIVKIAKEVFGQ